MLRKILEQVEGLRLDGNNLPLPPQRTGSRVQLESIEAKEHIVFQCITGIEKN